MKVLLLSDANCPHTIKWVEGLSNRGVHVGLWSISKPNKGVYEGLKNVTLFYTAINQNRFSWTTKIKYLTLLPNLKKTISEFNPDLVHAHYASSFGLLGALTKTKPYILSVWGSDVYDFPKKNVLFKKIVEYNLKIADKILSTSHVMAEETNKYTSKRIEVTPFGIDLEMFKKKDTVYSDVFTVGTVKTLEEKYGIIYLLEAFAIFHNKYPLVNKKLLIVGGGTLMDRLRQDAKRLGIDKLTDFLGKVPYRDVPKYHDEIDVCCCLSILDSESFGVSAIESSALENPVIVSDVGGLPEVIENDVTGIVVPPKNSQMAANAIEKLYLNKELRIRMGKKGRERVKEFYNWQDNIDQMIRIYHETLGYH